VQEIEAIMVEDEGLRQFWRSVLEYEYTCKVGKMMEELAEYLGADPQDPRLHMLAHLLTPTNGFVTIEQFTNLLHWFGPLKGEKREEDRPSPSFLAKLEDICCRQWFHGILNREETLDRLADKIAGTYLVRLSLSEPGTYVVAYVDKSSVKQLKVSHDSVSGLVFLVPETKFEGIVFLVEHYASSQPEKFGTPCKNGFLDRITQAGVEYTTVWG